MTANFTGRVAVVAGATPLTRIQRGPNSSAARRTMDSMAAFIEPYAATAPVARRAVSDTVLRAPQDAVVTARDMAPGQIVGAAQAVLTLATLEGLEAVFNAPDHPRLDSAMNSPVRLDTIEAPAAPAKAGARPASDLVARLSSAADEADYRVDRLLAGLTPPAAVKRGRRP